jgi:serine/threonine-protein kinase
LQKLLDPTTIPPIVPVESQRIDDGQVVGKYRLIASLGHGGMADVYLAVVSGPAGFNKLQVIKRLRAECAEDPEYVAMFLDEARLAARLNHPNVVQTFEVSEAEGEYFMAMEYLEGAPLNRIMNRTRGRREPEALLLRVVADALSGLHYAHELTNFDGTPLSIVHRDASPHNIFVTYEGQTKVVDFGIAKAATRSNETRTGVVKGKVGYMAPEQARCLRLDRRADVFVLGIVLWEVLAGRKMWERATDMEVLHRLVAGNLPRIEEVRPDIAPELARICARALAGDPQERYATAAEMRAELLGYMDRAGLRVAPEDVGKFVGDTFADKRAEIRKVIERQLGKLSAPAADAALPEVGAAMEAEPESLPRIEPVTGPHSASMRNNAPSNRSIPPPQPAVTREQTAPVPAPRSRTPLIAAVAVLLIGALGGFVLLRSKETPSAQAAPAAGTEAAPVPTAASPTTAPTTTTAAPTAAVANGTMIELKVRTVPAAADVFLDGAKLPSNPFTGKFPADGVSHRVHAEAAEYRSAAKIVVFDRDVSVDLILDPKSGAAVAAGSKAEPTSEPTSPPAAGAAVAQQEEAAGLAAKPAAGAKPKRALDGADAWSTSAPAATTTAKKRKLDGATNPW